MGKLKTITIKGKGIVLTKENFYDFLKKGEISLKEDIEKGYERERKEKLIIRLNELLSNKNKSKKFFERIGGFEKTEKNRWKKKIGELKEG